MPRTKRETAPADAPAVDETRMDGALTVLRQTGENAVALAQQLGYEGALTVDALEDRIRIGQRRTVEAVMDLGASLLLLREITPHGEFGGRLEQFGFAPRMAQRLMSAALKFSNATSKSLLAAAGSQTKLLELVALDEDEIEALDAGESVRGIQLDDIDKMSVRELREALRESNADAEATKKVMADKNAALDKERAKSKRVKSMPPDQALKELQQEANVIRHACWAALRGQLLPACEALRAHDDANSTDNTLFMAGMVGEIQAELAAIRTAFNLPDVSDAATRQLADEVAQWAGDAPAAKAH